VRGWINDLRIGVRLAVGGGRTSIARLALSTIGIGIAVAVLLLAASVDPMIQARTDRTAAMQPNESRIDDVAPLRFVQWGTEFKSDAISVLSIDPTGSTSPRPPGLPAMPAVGEFYASQALADLLAADGSELLRERFPQRMAGVIDPDAVTAPDSMFAVVRTGPITTAQGKAAYSFGIQINTPPMDPGLLLLILLGSVALLVPVFIFIASSTRIAGAERDRRLSALRLVGADGTQVRRIAAAEGLVGAVIGLVLGTGLFLVGRQAAAGVRIMDVSVYPGDISPTWWLAVLVVLAIPVLAVLTAQFALRRTIIEPLSVVRFSKPLKRRMVPRVAAVLLGVALLIGADELRPSEQLWSVVVATGATLLLVGVPLLLPWVVERTVSGLRGGSSSWQLAIRRLQLDSGTSARVVSGVAVVLAGAIALQSVLLSISDRFGPTEYVVPLDSKFVVLVGTDEAVAKLTADLTALAPAAPVERYRDVYLQFDRDGAATNVRVADCALIERKLAVTGCADGQMFSTYGDTDRDDGLTPGRKVYLSESGGTSSRYAEWTVPAIRREVSRPATDEVLFGVVVADGPSAPKPDPSRWVAGARVYVSDESALERVRTAAVKVGPDVHAQWFWASTYHSPQEELFLTIRRGLLGGSLFTLMLAGVSLLVLALEHIRERRRPLAILAASGVPTGALARSLFWQIAVPIGLGVVVAFITGLSLSALIMRLTASADYQVDWVGVGVMTVAAIVLGLLVSVLTLPFLRGATRLSSMRTE